MSAVPRYKAYDYFIEHDSAAGEHRIEIDRGVGDLVTSFELKRPKSRSVFAFRYILRSQEFDSPVQELNEKHRFLQFNWQSFLLLTDHHGATVEARLSGCKEIRDLGLSRH